MSNVCCETDFLHMEQQAVHILEAFWHALERMALFSGTSLLISAPRGNHSLRPPEEFEI